MRKRNAYPNSDRRSHYRGKLAASITTAATTKSTEHHR